MKPIFLTIGNGLNLMIIPDIKAHLNGHVILTYTYSIFLNDGLKEPQLNPSEGSTLHLDKINDPDYYGYLTFESPGNLFSYTADGQQHLEIEEVNELIEKLSHMRDNPQLWNLN
ncbi:hypothetical protein [Mucilaginibacter sp.]